MMSCKTQGDFCLIEFVRSKFEPWGWYLSLHAGFDPQSWDLASKLVFEPLGWYLSLQAGIWASHLWFEHLGRDLSLKGGGGWAAARANQQKSSSVLQDIVPFGAVAQKMYERRDKWKNEWMDEWMNKWIDWWINDSTTEWWMNEWMNRWIDEWMNGWMNGWIDSWTVKWMNGWIEGWINDWTGRPRPICGQGYPLLKSRSPVEHRRTFVCPFVHLFVG